MVLCKVSPSPAVQLGAANRQSVNINIRQQQHIVGYRDDEAAGGGRA